MQQETSRKNEKTLQLERFDSAGLFSAISGVHPCGRLRVPRSLALAYDIENTVNGEGIYNRKRIIKITAGFTELHGYLEIFYRESKHMVQTRISVIAQLSSKAGVIPYYVLILSLPQQKTATERFWLTTEDEISE